MILIGKNEYKYGRMLMSHMASDDLQELHSFAKLLGIQNHFQDKPSKPHYDLCKSKKAQAIKLGAIEVNDREIIKLFKAVK